MPLITSDISVEGIKIHVARKEGKGLPVIFLHDSLGCTRLWRNFPQKMAEATSLPVWAYDRQGYGQSEAFSTDYRNLDYMHLEADRLIDLMDTCNIRQAILFGHSDGGSIALLAASRYPDRIAAIITEGAHIFVEPLTLSGIRDAATQYTHTDLRQRLYKYHGTHTDAVFHAWADTWLRPDFQDWNIEDCLPHIHCPSLVIQGAEDEYGTAAQVDRIAAQVSGPVQTWMVPEAGHSPHKEQAELVIQRCQSFLTAI